MAGAFGAHAEDAAQPLARLQQIQGSAAGSTVQLGADFLSYARARSTPVEFKHQLVERLLPTVPRRGQPHPIEPGQPFGKFTIVEKLGKGGMAVVYRALDPERASGSDFGSRQKRERDQYVALKVMKEDLALQPEYVRRFLREAANAALIAHPNVVSVFEVGSVSGRLYFTMELIEGETLKDTLARGPLGEDDGIQVLCQLVDGLEAAHERGIGHRDLKPSNIMLVTSRARYGVELKDDFDVRVKVTDFGLAHMLDADTSDVTPEGGFLGTAKYVAPEVIKGGETTLKSDLFSLGVLAFQMFAGRAPFQAKTKLEFITANLQAKAPLLNTVVPQISRDLALLVDAMLDKEPERRPDAQALRKDLARLAGRRSGKERVVVDDPSSAFHETGLGKRPRAPSPAVLAGGGVAAAVVVLVLLVVLFKSPPPPPPPPPVVTERPKPPPPDVVTERPPPEPTGVRGVESLPWVPLPPRAEFADAMACVEFTRAVERGDVAWAEGRPLEALSSWEAAERLAPAALEPLRARVRGARRDAALLRADEAQRRGNTAQEVLELEAAVAFGADGHEVAARLERARALRELQQKLTDAPARRARDPAAAVRALEELLPLARSLGAEYEGEVQAALARARGVAPPSTETPTATEPPPGTPRTPAEERLAQAEGLLREQLYDAAERAIEVARESGAPAARVELLLRRLSRARLTPEGFVFLEVPGQGEPHGFYARPERVTNREFHAWFAGSSAAMMPPRAWRGAGSPPKGEEDEPVTGVVAEQARAFAEARGDRLATAPELEALRAHVRAPAGAGVPGEGGRYDGGFYTVRDTGRP
jgi:serine/threonine protein kinase